MRKPIFLFVGLMFVAVFSLGHYFYKYPSLLHGGVREFGSLMLGRDYAGGEGSYTFAPTRYIPNSRFYITVVQKDLWCVFEYCSPEGIKIKSLGGWLQGENTDQPTIWSEYGLETNPSVESVIVVADKNNKLVGIYPNKKIDDIPAILKVHWRLIQVR